MNSPDIGNPSFDSDEKAQPKVPNITLTPIASADHFPNTKQVGSTGAIANIEPSPNTNQPSSINEIGLLLRSSLSNDADSDEDWPALFSDIRGPSNMLSTNLTPLSEFPSLRPKTSAPEMGAKPTRKASNNLSADLWELKSERASVSESDLTLNTYQDMAITPLSQTNRSRAATSSKHSSGGRVMSQFYGNGYDFDQLLDSINEVTSLPSSPEDRTRKSRGHESWSSDESGSDSVEHSILSDDAIEFDVDVPQTPTSDQNSEKRRSNWNAKKYGSPDFNKNSFEDLSPQSKANYIRKAKVLNPTIIVSSPNHKTPKRFSSTRRSIPTGATASSVAKITQKELQRKTSIPVSAARRKRHSLEPKTTFSILADEHTVSDPRLTKKTIITSPTYQGKSLLPTRKNSARVPPVARVDAGKENKTPAVSTSNHLSENDRKSKNGSPLSSKNVHVPDGKDRARDVYRANSGKGREKLQDNTKAASKTSGSKRKSSLSWCLVYECAVLPKYYSGRAGKRICTFATCLRNVTIQPLTATIHRSQKHQESTARQ
jgi:hypothetical protein